MSNIPEWAMDAAASLRSAVVWQSNAANEIIARALVDAERRGRMSIADMADAYADRADVGAKHATSARQVVAYQREEQTLRKLAAAIRQLAGDTP